MEQQARCARGLVGASPEAGEVGANAARGRRLLIRARHRAACAVEDPERADRREVLLDQAQRKERGFS